MSHVRKVIERAVVDELDELTSTDRMQFGFQRSINTLQAAIDVAAVISNAVEFFVAVLDLTNAYDRVVRRLLIEKLERLNVPRDLINQIIVFLVPLMVQTAGDVTKLTVVLTTGLTQGGAASPALFRLFIDDLATELRKPRSTDNEATDDSLVDPAKLFADDVIIVAKSAQELQTFLDICSAWDSESCLEWKPEKCTVIAQRQEALSETQFKLAGKPIPVRDEERYLGILITNNGLTKKADRELEGKCVAACMATVSQPFFDAELTNETLCTLYRTNIRSIITYGLILTSDITEMAKLDRRLLSMFLKPIIQHKRKIPDRLIDRVCLRIRIPSLEMELENAATSWISKLRYQSTFGINKKVRRHAKDSIRALQRLNPDTLLRKHYTRRGGNKHNILLNAFKKWNEELEPSKSTSRTVDRVTKLKIEEDILDSPRLSLGEKCSAYRYLVYRFPCYTTLNDHEEEDLRLLLRQDLRKQERDKLINTLHIVHDRDEKVRKEEEAKAELKRKEKDAIAALMKMTTMESPCNFRL